MMLLQDADNLFWNDVDRLIYYVKVKLCNFILFLLPLDTTHCDLTINIDG